MVYVELEYIESLNMTFEHRGTSLQYSQCLIAIVMQDRHIAYRDKHWINAGFQLCYYTMYRRIQMFHQERFNSDSKSERIISAQNTDPDFH